ncbi:SUMF1/EgtB/PvdO family nonheme iron enzyme [Aggregatilineales bacterium SYSU G02658]
MQIFISYPRLWQHFCLMLRDLLEAHDVWIDHRLYAGQQWWPEIVKQISARPCFIYLLSEASLKSKYCNAELQLAHRQHKLIIPIKCEDVEYIPQLISRYQMVDMSHGMTVPAVRELLNALIVAERRIRSVASVNSGTRVNPNNQSVDKTKILAVPGFEIETLMQDITKSIESGNFDHAILLMEEARNRRLKFAAFDLEALLKDTKQRREQQEYRIEREHEYRLIAAMINSHDAGLRHQGLTNFQKYRQVYPDYDPLNLSALCVPLILPELKWCVIPAGEVTLRYPDRKAAVTYDVPMFQMSKYPITNAQYQIFVDAPDGYKDKRWWNYSPAAQQWREKHPTALPPRSPYGDHPRVNISWFDAMAFCHWLSYKTGWRISLPTEQQWQRAAQGDDHRQYPWGPRFYRNRANGVEARADSTLPVNRFAEGASPFGVMDMAGNCWEFTKTQRRASDQTLLNEMVAKGGSYLSPYTDIRVTSRTYVKPSVCFGTVGFRVVINFGN